jgi:hypothetical protein
MVLFRSPTGFVVSGVGDSHSRFRLAANRDAFPRLNKTTGSLGLVLPLGDFFVGDRKRNFFFLGDKQLLGVRGDGGDRGDGGGEVWCRSATEVGEAGGDRGLRRPCIVPDSPRRFAGSRLGCVILLRPGEGSFSVPNGTSMATVECSRGRKLMLRNVNEDFLLGRAELYGLREERESDRAYVLVDEGTNQ